MIYLLLLIIDKLNISEIFTFAGSLFVDCGKLFYSGILVFYIQKIFNKRIFLLFISLFLMVISFLGNFKLFLFFPSLLLFFVSIEIFMHESLKNVFSTLGNLTYAIYLLHVPVQISLIILVGYFNINNEIFISNYFFIIYIFFMLFLSYLCFNLYEKPINKKIRSFFN